MMCAKIYPKLIINLAHIEQFAKQIAGLQFVIISIDNKNAGREATCIFVIGGGDPHTLINTQKVYGLAWYHGRGAGDGEDCHSRPFELYGVFV